MSNPANGEVWRVRPLCFCPSLQQLGQIDLACEISSVVGAFTDDDLADAMDALFGPLLKPWMASVSSYIGTVVVRLNPAPVSVSVASAVAAGVGSTGNDQLPTQCAGLLTLRTRTIGRSARGRAYIAFPCLSEVDPTGVLSAGALVTLGNLATALTTVLVMSPGGGVTANATFGVWSKKLSSFFPFSDAAAANGFATQRKRGFFGRRNVEPSL